MNKLKKYFIPHKGNEYKPHFFRGPAVLVSASLIGFLFVFASALSTIVVQNTSQLGAVISSVLVDLTNADRNANQLQGLKVSPLLEKVAQMKADDMASKGYFAHNSPEGKTPWYWFKEAGYTYSFAGENLAVYFSDSAELEKAWMNSPGHRANILNSYFTEIGVAMARGTYQGQDTVYVVQVFGRPTRQVASVSVVNSPVKSPIENIPAKSIAKITSVQKQEVKGATTEAPVKVLAQEDTFIAVQNIDQTLPESTTSIEKSDISKGTPIILQVTASPKTYLKKVYAFIAVIIALALFFMIGVEIKRQHARHIIYGILLLALMAVLLYVWQGYLFGSLLVI